MALTGFISYKIVTEVEPFKTNVSSPLAPTIVCTIIGAVIG